MKLEFFEKHWKEILLVFLIFFLGLAVRAYMMRYELWFEFDTYWHAKITSIFMQTGIIPERDPLGYYQIGQALVGFPSYGLYYLSTFIYKIGTLGAIYNKELWIWFVKFLPAFYGALISVAMYFLGKVIAGKRLAVLLGFFTAVSSAFVYRTMAGQYEEDCLGFLWMIIGFIFLIKANQIKNNLKMVISSVLAGLFFVLMILTWEMHYLIAFVMLVYLVLAGIYVFLTKENTKELISFFAPWLISFLIYIAGLFALRGINLFASLDALFASNVRNINPLIAIGFVAVICVMIYIFYLMSGIKLNDEKYKKLIPKIIVGLYCAIAIGSLIFIALYQEPTVKGVLGATVGEESLGAKFFYSKYGMLMILPIIAPLLMPFALLKNKKLHPVLLLFAWTLITFYMAWTKLKFTYTFGLGVAASAGFALYYLSDLLESGQHVIEKKLGFTILFAVSAWFVVRSIMLIKDNALADIGLIAVFALIFWFVYDIITKQEKFSIKKLMPLAIGFFMISAVATTTVFVQQHAPNIELASGWKPALSWLRENTPTDSKIFNWWDEGHWISFIGERNVLLDNRNYDGDTASKVALFLLSTDLNWSLKYLQSLDSEYVMLSADLLAKQRSLAVYGYQVTDESDPRLRQPYVTFYFGCSFDATKNVFNCGPNSVPKEQFEVYPSEWLERPNAMLPSLRNMNDQSLRDPGFIYKQKDNSIMYLVYPLTNDSVLGKIWFNSPATKEILEEVYFAGEVKIFKVNKELLAQAIK